MHPESDLIRLAAHKAVLRRTIARRRAECVTAYTRVVRPLAWVDQGVTVWRSLSPWVKLATLPVTFLFGRAAIPRARLLGTVLRWSPVVLAAWHRFAAGQRR
jgi:hypothetical protein